MLRTIIRVSETEIVEANLYYSPEYVERKNKWGVTMKDATGTQRVVLNASAMKSDGLAYSGGLGRSYEMSTGHKRKTMKELEKIAAQLSDESIIAASKMDSKPTLIVGRA